MGVYWNPTEYKVIIKPDKVEEKTKGGIYLPDDHAERQKHAQTTGRIVAKSPLAFTYASAEEWDAVGGRPPAVGDTVMYTKYDGVSFEGFDGEDYIIINDKAVTAVKEAT